MRSRLNELTARHAREDAERRASDWRVVLAMPEGRRILQHIVSLSGLYLVHTTADGLELATGRRNLGAELRSEALAASPENVALAETEAVAEAGARSAAIADAAAADREARGESSIFGTLLNRGEDKEETSNA